MSRRVQLVILCEDKQQFAFAKRYFENRGFHPRKIRPRVSPTGKGAGEQYVRERYPKEVKAYRNIHVATNLVVLIDADTHSVQERLRQLDLSLEEAGLSKRQAGEEIAIFVPKRNIETWIHYADGQPVNEEDVYPKLARERDCKPAVDRYLQELCPNGLSEDAPPSLQTACDELSRIFS